MITPDQFVEISREAWAIADAHGWHMRARPEEELLELIMSELSEATEALRTGNPESGEIPGYSHVAEELADVVIRAGDSAWIEISNASGRMDWALLRTGRISHLSTGGGASSHLGMIWGARASIVAMRSQLVAMRPDDEWAHMMWWIVQLAGQLAAEICPADDLLDAIRAKMEHNRGRSWRHGGRAC